MLLSLACSLKTMSQAQIWTQKGSGGFEEAELEKEKSFLASEDDQKRYGTMETMGSWDFNHQLFELRGNEYTTIPVDETTSLGEVDMTWRIQGMSMWHWWLRLLWVQLGP